MTSPQDTKQGSGAWFEARLGRVTASRISDVMAKTKSGYGAGRLNYMVELVCERLTGEMADHFVSNAMTWGIENEASAIAEYELASGNMVEPVGFVEHPEILMSGASPDGRVGTGGLTEAKCPGTAQHIKTLMGEKIQRGYMLQMQWQIDCEQRVWCDYISFDPRLPGNLQLAIIRVERDASMIADIRSEVKVFLGDLDKLEAKLRARSEEPIQTGGNIDKLLALKPTVAENIDPTKLKTDEVF